MPNTKKKTQLAYVRCAWDAITTSGVGGQTMANNSGYLARQQAIKQNEMRLTRLFALQYAADAAAIAANKVFHRRGEIIAEFVTEMMMEADRIAKITLKDAKDDKQIDYTKGSVDRDLLRILGEEYFSDWETRYDIK
jgi:hypothetical protein